MRTALTMGAAIVAACAASCAFALVHVDIDLTHQRMRVQSDEGSYSWPVSTARSGFSTPPGSYAPTHLELMHYSRKYDNSPMPHAIFFRGGYAIHGTYATGSLGRPASHGCVRLSPGNAAALYAMVQREGARISIHGSPPASLPFAVAEGHARHRHIARADRVPAQAESYYGYSPTVPAGTTYGAPSFYAAPTPSPTQSLFGF